MNLRQRQFWTRSWPPELEFNSATRPDEIMTNVNQHGGAAVVVLTAAGSGSRLGLNQPKALVEVEGTSLVRHAGDRLALSPQIVGCVVTAPTTHIADFVAAMAGLAVPVVVVGGGDTRQASVLAGLAAITDLPEPARSASIVLVHDAARAFAPTALFSTVVEAINAGASAVVPVLPVADTLQRVAHKPNPAQQANGSADADVIARIGNAVGPIVEGLALGTEDRTVLRAVQTPQGFDRGLLERAHAAATHDQATDDAGLVEALGEQVWLLAGSEDAAKVTTARDLAIARALHQGVGAIAATPPRQSPVVEKASGVLDHD